MEIPAKAVQVLRRQTGAGIMDAKKALVDAKGDEAKALAILQERHQVKADKKRERAVADGVIHSYIHTNRQLGVLLELQCETDFVARNDKFTVLAQDLTLQIAGFDPPPTTPDELLKQSFVKDPAKTVQEVVDLVIANLGENIKVARFVRWELGEDQT